MKWILVLILVTATTLGDVARSRGMKNHGEVREFHPGAIRRALWALARNKWVILSTTAMAVSFFTFVRLVSIAPLSFAVPVSAATLIPETILARIFLREKVDWRRWAGAGLIALGVALISQ
ncbi:MAG TPA: EamA family transporter [Bryobacteraceae bacterium]|nr:EamA family transporter [Bryobacteraceae bacterium]